MKFGCIMLAVSTLMAAFFLSNALIAQQDGVSSVQERSKNAESNRSKKKDKNDTETSRASESEAKPTFFANRKMEMRFGIQFEANDNACTKIEATLPFPTNWPEQTVKIIAIDLPPSARSQFREVRGGAVQLVFEAASVPPQGRLDAIARVEIEKSFTKAPVDPSLLVIPKKISKELNWYVGDSPYIETKDRLIKKVVAEIQEQKPDNAWQTVEKFYDWVRENIEYKNGEIRSTKKAMLEKSGDCEEMTGIFVALCRAADIPARCVWIPDHCYPEFYLEDENGDGHWYPCQVAGDRQFGEMSEYRPILQKGDRFTVPEKKTQQRYVSEHFTCKQKPVGPKNSHLKTIRDLGALQGELDALKAAGKLDPPSSP